LVTAWRSKPSTVGPPQRPTALIGFAAIGLAASISSHLIYTSELDLPLDWYTFHWRDGAQSVNSTTHIHTSKASIALVINLFSLGSLHQSYDTGLAFLNVVPIPIAALNGIGFLGAWIAGLCWATRRASQSIFTTGIVLILAVISLTKCIMDGGPLAYDAVASTITIFVITKVRPGEHILQQIHAQRLNILLFLGFWIAAMAMLDQGAIYPQLGRAAVRLCTYALILLVPHAIRSNLTIRPKSIRLALIACGAIVGAMITSRAKQELIPLYTYVPEQIISMNTDGTSVRIDPLTGSTRSNRRNALNTYLHYEESPRRVRRLSILNRNHVQSSGILGELTILTNDLESDVRFVNDQIIAMDQFEVRAANGDWLKANFKASFSAHAGPLITTNESHQQNILADNERFVTYYALDNFLRRAGIEEYVLIPYLHFSEPDTRHLDNTDTTAQRNSN